MPHELFPTDGPKKSAKAARLREALPSIEMALSQGHAHAAIHQRLGEEFGLDITFAYYQLIVHRLRKEQAGAAQAQTEALVTGSGTFATDGSTRAAPAPIRLASVDGGNGAKPVELEDSKFTWDPMAPVRW